MEDSYFSEDSRTRVMRLIYVIAFAAGIGNPMVLPCFPHVMAEFGLNALELGMMITAFAVPALVAVPLTGVISDRIGRKPLLLACLAGAAAGSLICMVAPNYTVMLGGRILQGFSFTPLESSLNTLATDLYEGDARRTCVCRANTAMFLSIALAPLIVSALLLVTSWRSCFLLGIVLGLIGFLCCLRAELPYRPPRNSSLRSYATHLRESMWSLRALLLFSVRFLSAFIIFGVFYAFYPLLVCSKIGAPASSVGPGFSFYAIGMFLGAASLPRLSHRLPQWGIGILGGSLYTGFAVTLFLSTSLWTAFLGSLLIGLASGIISTSAVSHVSMITTDDTRASVLSAYSLTFRLCQSVSPTACGMLFTIGSFDAVFGAGIAACLLLTLIATCAFCAAASSTPPSNH